MAGIRRYAEMREWKVVVWSKAQPTITSIQYDLEREGFAPGVPQFAK